jgi:hypothetical protein
LFSVNFSIIEMSLDDEYVHVNTASSYSSFDCALHIKKQSIDL